MDETFRLDLEGYNKEYIQEVLHTFFERAAAYDRRLIEIRMSMFTLNKLAIEQSSAEPQFKGVPITVGDSGFEETIEVVLRSLLH